ncbi:MAG: hypothetical protein R3C12_21625 [Planctomycetaceae bacterium]
MQAKKWQENYPTTTMQSAHHRKWLVVVHFAATTEAGKLGVLFPDLTNSVLEQVLKEIWTEVTRNVDLPTAVGMDQAGGHNIKVRSSERKF